MIKINYYLEKIKRFFSRPYLYLVLISIYPLLHFYSKNPGQADWLVLLFLISSILILTVLIFFICRLIFKEEHRAAVLAAFFMLLFMSYGRFYQLMQGWQFGIYNSTTKQWVVDIFLGRHRYLILLFVLSLALIFWLLKKTKSKFENENQIFNVSALVLILFPLFTISNYYANSMQIIIKDLRPTQSHSLQVQGQLPDIYYIIPDEYPRQDILKTYFNHDNSKFIEGLKDRGFCVVDNAYTNYAQTLLSLASSLNMRYINDVGEQSNSKDQFVKQLDLMVRDSLVQSMLEEQGYFSVAFASGFSHTEPLSKTVDLYIAPRGNLGEFVNEFINTTPLGFFSKSIPTLSPYRKHRDRVLFVFDKLPEVAKIKASTFTIAHIVSPHPPFVFDKHGSAIVQNQPFSLDAKQFTATSQDYTRRFSEQAEYIGYRLLNVIDQILENSEEPPIIIIQSDTGPGGDSVPSTSRLEQIKIRMTGLNAYYLPAVSCLQVKPDITPVNSFRLLFNQYFGGDFSLLDNHLYHSGYNEPTKFEALTQELLK